MALQAYALRPVHLRDLPALKRWRGLPEVQRHLRHPHAFGWWRHLRWWWNNGKGYRVYAVTLNGDLIGVAGFYYIAQGAAELSILCVTHEQEDYPAERQALRLLLREARTIGLSHVWAEVVSTASLGRHSVFWGLPAVRDLPLWVERPTPYQEGHRYYWYALNPVTILSMRGVMN